MHEGALDMYNSSRCRWPNASSQQNDVYKLFFSFANISKLLDRVEAMGFPRPKADSDGMYANLFKVYRNYPGYQGVGPEHWTRETLLRHVEFLNGIYMRLFVPEMYAKQALYDDYDRRRSSPLQAPDTPYLDYCTRRAPIYTGRLMR